jgi:hypothetical protein
LKTRPLDEIPVQLRLEGEISKIGRVELVGTDHIRVKKEGQGAGSFFIVLPTSIIRSRKTSLEVGLYQGIKRSRS